MQPLLIAPYQTGMQTDIKPFMLMDEAFPNLLNCFCFRGRVERKNGQVSLGRLRRQLTSVSGTTITSAGAGNVTYNLFTGLGLNVSQPNAQVEPGNITAITIVIGAPISTTLTDSTGTGILVPTPTTAISSATINYSTGNIVLTFTGAFAASSVTISMAYYPGLPVMGVRSRENTSNTNFQLNQTQTIWFDTVYAYQYNGGFSELPSTIPTTWSGPDTNQFWTTNYEQNAAGQDMFWATNYTANITAFTVTLFAGATSGPPSTVTVTAPGNTFTLGEVITFSNLTGTAAANNGLTGFVIAIPTPGSTITIQNPGTGVFTNGAVTGGFAIALDGIKYYAGSSNANATWLPLIPQLNTTNLLVGGLIILAWKNRLLVFNTLETTSPTSGTFVTNRQRVRWSQNRGNVLDVVNSWRDDNVGFGGFEDAATDESIVSAGFVKDQLIVEFERSTWQLVFTGNDVGPFIWQRINSELGAESTFSAVTFDNALVTFGNIGLHSCNGVHTQRIDAMIPDEIFNVHNNVDGPKRTSGVRDYFNEVAYYAYSSDLQNTSSPSGKTFFPNKIMVYNYRNNTFAFFDTNVTSFGYYQPMNDLTWNQITWDWDSWNTSWNSGAITAGFPNVCFGNQQGFSSILSQESVADDVSLFIQAISSVGVNQVQITSPQHNLFAGQYVAISNALGITSLNGTSAEIISIVDANNFIIESSAVISGTYLGQGEITVLSNIVIATKQFTPYWTKGKNYSLRYVDLLFDTTQAGEIAVDVFVDFSNTNSMTDVTSGVVLGAPVVSTAPEIAPTGQPAPPYYSFQKFGTQIWKRFYTFATGETFQIQLSFNPKEIQTPSIQTSDVVLHGMVLFFEEAGEFY